MKSLLLTLLSLIILTSCKKDQKEIDVSRDPVLEQEVNPALAEAETIALKNGIKNWDSVSQIAFTFNVDRGGKTVAKRSWLWKPKTDDVTMVLKGDSLHYNRSRIDSTVIAQDRGFINDKFWLLAPFQLVWDQDASLSMQDSAIAPISQRTSKKLTILYGDKGGYTPGDAYDFYYGDDYIIDEWVFRKSNSNSASMTTSFEDYATYEGLHLAATHKDLDSDLNIYFTDISVQQ